MSKKVLVLVFNLGFYLCYATEVFSDSASSLLNEDDHSLIVAIVTLVVTVAIRQWNKHLTQSWKDDSEDKDGFEGKTTIFTAPTTESVKPIDPGLALRIARVEQSIALWQRSLSSNQTELDDIRKSVLQMQRTLTVLQDTLSKAHQDNRALHDALLLQVTRVHETLTQLVLQTSAWKK